MLEAAGAAEADIIVALTSSDEVNMMACEVAYTLYRTPTKIARIRSAEYTSRPELFSEEALSVDVFISPEQLVTEYVERLIRYPGALQVLDFADGKVQLVGVRAQQGRPARRPARCASCASTCRSRMRASSRSTAAAAASLPEGDTVIEDGDEVFFLAARDDLRRVMSELRKRGQPGASAS